MVLVVIFKFCDSLARRKKKNLFLEESVSECESDTVDIRL
jgi:hypothetical protein